MLIFRYVTFFFPIVPSGMKTYRSFCDFIYNSKFIARKNCMYDHARLNDFSENNVRNEEDFTFYR